MEMNSLAKLQSAPSIGTGHLGGLCVQAVNECFDFKIPGGLRVLKKWTGVSPVSWSLLLSGRSELDKHGTLKGGSVQ